MGEKDESELQQAMCSQLWKMHIHRQHWKICKISLVDEQVFFYISMHFSSFHNRHTLLSLSTMFFCVFFFKSCLGRQVGQVILNNSVFLFL